MAGREEFLESLSSLLSLAEVSDGCLSQEQIRENFDGFNLTEENWEQIYRYLERNHIHIRGREAEKSAEQALEEAIEADLHLAVQKAPKKAVAESPFLKLYRQELESILPLEAEEGKELWRLMKEEGSEAARNRLLESRLMLASEVAAEFTGQGISEADLIQEANLALLLALEGCEGTFTDLDLFAAEEIRQSLQDMIEEETGNRNTAQYLASQANRLLELSTEIAEESGHEPTMEDLCQRMHMTEEAVRELMKMSLDAASVNES